ncbi:TonB family protein [Spirosoma sp. HMF4905]|uniref:TonB family protein n=1 Tax=Spirosoma arboris TaxID=2682092 RepID=A0A7K1SRE1_9BACT|nr:TonB family protein [Spirosoma arboris]MVM36372.1 TonB family protein [Spirosoma arboris]
MRKAALVCLLSCLLTSQTRAQTDSTRSVRGRVTNSRGQPLAGAIVAVFNSSKGTPTDQDGFYLLSNVPNEATLVFMNFGYQLLVQSVPNQANVLNQQVLNVSLEIAPEELPPMGATAAYKAINKNTSHMAGLYELPAQTGAAMDRKAYFPTGTVGMIQYVAHHLRYPAQAKLAKVEGDVLVEFTVTPIGAIEGVKVSKSLFPACDQEALRVVRQMPRWVAAQQLGQLVSSVYVVPIRFALK